jgi:alpha,alpha-trehalose phosphorylase
MLRRRLDPPRDIFPIDDWALVVAGYRREVFTEYVGQSETMFALANGFLGMRGTPEEDHPVYDPGTFLNGFYEIRPIVYGEHAYGFPKVGQTMLNCPSGAIIKLYVDDQPFELESAEVVGYSRDLDMRDGVLRREVVFETAMGKRVRVTSLRLVSLAYRNLAAIRYEVTCENADADLIVSSELINRQPLPVDTTDPRLGQGLVGRVLDPTGTRAESLRVILSFRTKGSGLALGCGMDHHIETAGAFTTSVSCEDDIARVVLKVSARAGAPVCLTKYLSYHYSGAADPSEIRARTAWTLDRALEEGFVSLHERQKSFVQSFWERADVEVESGLTPEKQQTLRWNLFQLLQASARAEGCGIGARGLTGKTYEGHYFWDTEIYVLPFLLYTQPRMARSLLKHRYDQLDKARARARELSHPGATFPWRTINGEEASAYYAAGTAQYHINADIMYALRKYVEVSGDVDFMHRYGAEMLVETARFWLDLGGFTERNGRQFRINGVTGPDEYTALVNNNFFTNVMARENLGYAACTVRLLEQQHPATFRALVGATGVTLGEVADWEEAAALMYLPYDERLGIYPQDDSFLDKEHWDYANTPEENYPLLLHYHPLNLYRHQVIKQADTLLALFLLGDEFTLEDKKRNFDYYDPLTTHDSSLSVCIQCIVAAEIGYLEKAREYFDFAAVMDLADVGGNMMHGAHIASIGGTWLALVYGFGGMRDHGGHISFRPRLAGDWRRLSFRLTIRDSFIQVDIRPDETTYTLREGAGLRFAHDGAPVALRPEAPVVSCPTSTTLPDIKAELGAPA